MGAAAAERTRALRRLFGEARRRGLDVRDLRGMASRRGWGDSVSALDARQTDALLAALLGRAVQAPTADGAYLRFPFAPARLVRRQMAYASRLLFEIGQCGGAAGAALDDWGWRYAAGVARRMFGGAVAGEADASPARADDLRRLSGEQWHAVCTALTLRRDELRRNNNGE